MKHADQVGRTMMRLDATSHEAATHAALIHLMDYEYWLCSQQIESTKKTTGKVKKPAMCYDMVHCHEMAAALQGVKVIERGEFIWSPKAISVGNTTQVMIMYSVSMEEYSLFREAKMLFTDVKFAACPTEKRYDPVLAHEITPAPPHQYIGWTTVADGLGKEPIVVLSSHGYFACHSSQASEQNGID